MDTEKTRNKGGRPKLDPRMTKPWVMRVNMGAWDIAAVDAIALKRHLDRSAAVRMSIAHFVEFEGLRAEVEEKATLLISGAVSSAG